MKADKAVRSAQKKVANKQGGTKISSAKKAAPKRTAAKDVTKPTHNDTGGGLGSDSSTHDSLDY